jgi:diacylglycerol kinase family enzyme
LKRAASLLILSSKAGSMTPEIEAKLRKAFARSLVVEFDPTMELEKLVSPKGMVIVAGGDGTIGWVVRRLADTKHPVGILSLGTFNNFAKSLRLPTTVDAAIRVIKEGKPRPITLGRLNGKVFLEAAAIGLFGETIAAGESAKDRAFGAFADDLKHVMEARPFTYELTGDIKGSGSCMSLVFTNTTSIGSQMPVSDKTPEDPYLELSVHAGRSRTDIVKRVLARAVLSKHKEGGLGQVFKFRKLQVTTKPKVRIYADNAQLGRTPATITAELSALQVILSR